MNAKISETIRARVLGLGMQIPELLAQRKFALVPARVHAAGRGAWLLPYHAQANEGKGLHYLPLVPGDPALRISPVN